MAGKDQPALLVSFLYFCFCETISADYASSLFCIIASPQEHLIRPVVLTALLIGIFPILSPRLVSKRDVGVSYCVSSCCRLHSRDVPRIKRSSVVGHLSRSWLGSRSQNLAHSGRKNGKRETRENGLITTNFSSDPCGCL